MTREEAIEVYNGLINTKIKEAFEFFAPELRESEDEMVRKGLIDFVNHYRHNTDLTSEQAEWCKKALAYLKKQKPTPDWMPKFLDELRAKKHYFDWDEHRDIEGDILAIINWIDPDYFDRKEKGQIPYTDFVIKPHKGDDTNPYDMSASEAQEYTIKRGFAIPFIDGEVYVDERHITQTVGNVLRWADEHPKEKNPATAYTLQSSWETTNQQKPSKWSEEDSDNLERVDNYLWMLDDYVGDDCTIPQGKTDKIRGNIQEVLSPWLKSLPERFNLQPKQEWSEKDERILKGIIGKIDHDQTYGVSKLEMLSLLCRIRPSWKPSEEQMVELERVVNGKALFKKDFIEKLYNDLKKLM